LKWGYNAKRHTAAVGGMLNRTGRAKRPADWKSAIQQIGNLRYGGADAHFEARAIKRRIRITITVKREKGFRQGF
jgi:hypothetical protein